MVQLVSWLVPGITQTMVPEVFYHQRVAALCDMVIKFGEQLYEV
jgi:hypothetical protein